MNQQRFRRAGSMSAIAALALVVLAACGGGTGETELEAVTRVPTMSEAAAQATREAPLATPGTPGAATATGEVTAAPAEATPVGGGPAAAQPVEIVSHDIFFDPKDVTIPANTDVTITLPNEGVTAHNFSIDALDISVDIAPGATEQVVINTGPGEYEFYCNVPGHKAAGMVGTLIVSEDAAAAAPEAATPAEAAAAVTVASPAPATPAEATAEQAAAATPAAAATAATPAATVAEAAAPAAEGVEVVSHDIFFEPNAISIPADTDVTVTLPNEGVTPHNFSIDELGIDVDIDPGATEEVTINAPAGTYEFYCNVPGHRQAGMVGTLTVG